MADKYLRNSAGVIAEKEATVVSAGAGDAGEIVALDSTGKLDNSVMPVGIGADTASITASEALSAGDLVNIHNSSGAKARKADAAAAGKPAHGFVLAAVSNGAAGTVYFEGTNTQLSSLTAGDVYLSAAAPGGVTGTAPSGTGQVVQKVGVAVSATAINFEAGPPITLA